MYSIINLVVSFGFPSQVPRHRIQHAELRKGEMFEAVWPLCIPDLQLRNLVSLSGEGDRKDDWFQEVPLPHK